MKADLPRLVIYTVLFGNYDHLKELPALSDQIDAVCFTDNPALSSNTWRVIQLPVADLSPLINRKIKILPHRFLAEYEQSLYIDGSITLLQNPEPLFNKYLKNFGLAASKHPFRNCIFKEAWECVICGKANPKKMAHQIARYQLEQHPKLYGMTANGMLFRNHNSPDIIKLMELWWTELVNGNPRDQICLPYILRKTGTPITYIEESPWLSTEWFKLEKHEYEKGLFYNPAFIKLKKLWRIFLFGIPYKYYQVIGLIRKHSGIRSHFD